MIWYLIGYVAMGIWGSEFITGFVLGITLLKRGYVNNYGTALNSVICLMNDRTDKDVLERMADKNDIMAIVWIVFQVMTWPVELLRYIFIRIPDAIELYESQQKEGEQA